MHNCAADVVAYHNAEVRLPLDERTAMRDRRNANRQRLDARLADKDNPVPDEYIKQGSYAMLTMVQDPDNDYDIDDGAYFTQAALRNDDGVDMAPADVRGVVCAALQDDRFNKQPKVRDACVRVYYDQGYHVDIPVYRICESDGEYELANGDEWVVSRAADVEDWFNERNQVLSPDDSNGRQFRRIVRCLKKFARSRANWKESIATGFTITKLVAERYLANASREDTSLRDTMSSVHARLCGSLQVVHPVTPGSYLTDGPTDSRTAFLRDKLATALADLSVLDHPNCTRKAALDAWDKVFNTKFFSARSTQEATKAASTLRPAAGVAGLTFPDRPVVPNKPAGFA